MYILNVFGCLRKKQIQTLQPNIWVQFIYMHYDFLLQDPILSMTVSELEKSMMEHATTRNGAWPVRPGRPIHRTHLVLVC